MKAYNQIKEMFLTSNQALIRDDMDLLDSQVSERSLCGALMLHLNRTMLQSEDFEGYYTDVEYNRNHGNIKTIKKTIRGQEEQIVNVTCDLIMHSRGRHPGQDNLIAIGMKKANRPQAEKTADKERLKALTKDTFDDTWSYDGVTLPEHVCRYVIGIYYEIDFEYKTIRLEYYKQGERVEHQSLKF